jgi:two-component system chemotaxis response regulator CheY
MPYDILVVDDSPTVRMVIKKTLEIARVDTGNVHEAANGQDAMKVLEEHHVDFMFVDINMPVMNGIQLVTEMKRRDLLASVPVVIVSTEGSKTRIEELKAQGVSAYIRKPFTPEVLRNVVDEITGD